MTQAKQLHRRPRRVPSRGWRKTSRPARTCAVARRAWRAQVRTRADRERPPLAQQRGRAEDGGEDEQRQRRERDQPALVVVEDRHRREHHAAEDHQREDVQQRLGDDRAEDDRQARCARAAADAARDDHRAGRLAEAGGQRRRHQHADHRPLKRVAQPRARRGRHRGAQDRRPGDGAHHHRGAHQPERDEHPRRRGVQQRVADAVDADALQREERAREDRDGDDRHQRAAGEGEHRTPRALARRRRRLDARQAPRGAARLQVGGQRADADGQRAGRRPRARRSRSRPRRPPGPARRRAARRTARAVSQRGGRQRVAAGGVERQRPQRLAERGGVAARHEDAVGAVVDDVAVAGDVGGDDRRAGRKRLGQDHAEALAAQRRGGQDVGLAQDLDLGRVVDLAQDGDALAAVEQQRLDLLGRGADDLQLGGHVLAQRLEGAQQHRQALALDGLADERDLQRALGADRLGRRQLQRIGHRDAVGDHAVAAAVEALARPGGGLGDRDADLQAVEAAAGADARPRSRCVSALAE